MDNRARFVTVVRHAQTEWSQDGRHTGRTDVPLSQAGEADAHRLASVLGGIAFARVYSSPLRRARRTCELAGLADRAEIDGDLVEWDYGAYEGLTTSAIRAERPGWSPFRDGCPGGESVEAVAARADHVLTRLRSCPGRSLVFSHAHFLRVLAARWVGLPAADGRCLTLATCCFGTLAYDHGDEREPVISGWNLPAP